MLHGAFEHRLAAPDKRPWVNQCPSRATATHAYRPRRLKLLIEGSLASLQRVNLNWGAQGSSLRFSGLRRPAHGNSMAWDHHDFSGVKWTARAGHSATAVGKYIYVCAGRRGCALAGCRRLHGGHLVHRGHGAGGGLHAAKLLRWSGPFCCCNGIPDNFGAEFSGWALQCLYLQPVLSAMHQQQMRSSDT